MMKFVCSLLGIPFHYGTYEDLIHEISTRLEQNTSCDLIFTPNPEIMMIAEKDTEYKHILQQADVSLPDGNGLLFASSFLLQSANTNKLTTMYIFATNFLAMILGQCRKVIPDVITGSNSFVSIHEYLQNTSFSVFYFGGEHGVEKEIAVVMKQKYPSLHVAGSTGGYPFKNPDDAERILREIEIAKPDFLFIALSFPWQERWAVMNRDRLTKAGVKVAMVVGGTFDFALEKRKRAPVILQKLRFEWLWRLIQEPSRFGRICTAVIHFPLHVLKRRLAGEKDLLVLLPPVTHLHK